MQAQCIFRHGAISMYYLKHPKKCPQCGERAGAKILWGYPEMCDEMQEAISRGTLVLGGCVVSDSDLEYRCLSCNHEWENPRRWIVGGMQPMYSLVENKDQNKPYDVLCSEYSGLCNKKWDELIATDMPGMRFCSECKQEVMLIKTKRELKRLRDQSICVAYCGTRAIKADEVR